MPVEDAKTRHVVLLGDSVFDSRPYLRGEPHMAKRLEIADPRSRATLNAVSGSRLGDLALQMSRLPPDATHLIASVGGNDILDSARGLRSAAGGWAGRAGQLFSAFGAFQKRYASACDLLASNGLPAAVCTIYEPPVADPVLRQLGAAALHMINRSIETEARRAGLSVIDLRSICREPADFFDPIHPSARGADKIAASLAAWVGEVCSPADSQVHRGS